jgi:hypothetical protein
MTLMGYTEDDIDRFRGVLMNVYSMKSCNDGQAKVLQEISNFLDGLLVEGRI